LKDAGPSKDPVNNTQIRHAAMTSQPSPKSPGTPVSDTNTLLALKRTAMGADRTLMAWMRTALSMISFGFTMAKVFEYLNSSRGPLFGPLGNRWAPGALGVSMLALGTCSLALAVVEHRRALKILREDGLTVRWSLTSMVSTLVAMIGLLALLTLV